MPELLAEAILNKSDKGQPEPERKVLLAQVVQAVRDANCRANRRKVWPKWTIVDDLMAQWREARNVFS